jgi:hypothetical protein
MAITQCLPTSFKVQILTATHNFGTAPIRATAAADTYKIALYTSSASLDATTTAYTTSNEVPSTGNYTAGGNTLSISTVPSSGGVPATTAFLSFSNTTWANSTITNARGALIYNSTQGNAAVAIFDFGSDKSTTSGDFTIVFPAANASNAVIRIA